MAGQPSPAESHPGGATKRSARDPFKRTRSALAAKPRGEPRRSRGVLALGQFVGARRGPFKGPRVPGKNSRNWAAWSVATLAQTHGSEGQTGELQALQTGTEQAASAGELQALPTGTEQAASAGELQALLTGTEQAARAGQLQALQASTEQPVSPENRTEFPSPAIKKLKKMLLAPETTSAVFNTMKAHYTVVSQAASDIAAVKAFVGERQALQAAMDRIEGELETKGRATEQAMHSAIDKALQIADSIETLTMEQIDGEIQALRLATEESASGRSSSSSLLKHQRLDE